MEEQKLLCEFGPVMSESGKVLVWKIPGENHVLQGIGVQVRCRIPPHDLGLPRSQPGPLPSLH